MNKTKHTARDLARRLRPLEVSPGQLARVTGGGQTASTSTSGTPEAGDDTVGDATLRGSLPDVFVTSYQI